ncbi:MAG: stage V sporulation protein AC [Oscillospiraceae bacterium]
MVITKEEYKKLTEEYSENSKTIKNCFFAFSIGGLICTLGQLFINISLSMGMSKIDSSTIASIILIFLSALITGLGFYDNIAKLAGAGTLVPITGFANAITSPALEFKSEGYILGLSAKLYIIAGPVITYGISSSIIYGFIILIFNIR